jgi:hypothetical protein
VAIGGIAGLCGGLLGVGGGFVMVPLQVLWKRTSQRVASGTSLAAILPIAIAGALVYYLGKSSPQLDLPAALCLMAGGSAGALAGASLARVVPERALAMIVSVLLVAGAVKELHDAWLGGSAGVEPGAPALSSIQYALIALCGVVIGLLSGLTGVGGGILVVPTLVLGFGLGQRLAQGTSLLAILPTAAVGAIVHGRRHDLDGGAAGRMALVGVPTSVIGAVLALSLPERLLAGVFGLVLLAMAWRLWPRRPAASATAGG